MYLFPTEHKAELVASKTWGIKQKLDTMIVLGIKLVVIKLKVIGLYKYQHLSPQTSPNNQQAIWRRGGFPCFNPELAMDNPEFKVTQVS